MRKLILLSIKFHTRWLAIIIAALFWTTMAQAQPFLWNLDAVGTWDTTSANWLQGGTPINYSSTATSSAVFGGVVTANRTIAIQSGGITAGTLTFENTGPFAYTIGTIGNTLMLDNGFADAAITVGRGTIGSVNYAGIGGNTIAVSPVVFASNLVINNYGAFGTTNLTIASTIDRSVAGGMITVGGQGNTAISGAIGATVTGGLIKTGIGTLNLSSNSNAFSGGITINGGVLAVNTSNDSVFGAATNGITLASAATLRFAVVPGALTRTITVTGVAATPSGIEIVEGGTLSLVGHLTRP
ncbi:hypothetical protein BH11PLA2_BH11PLA2_38160 [soil metagenome]